MLNPENPQTQYGTLVDRTGNITAHGFIGKLSSNKHNLARADTDSVCAVLGLDAPSCIAIAMTLGRGYHAGQTAWRSFVAVLKTTHVFSIC